MGLREALWALRRRWYLATLGLLATVGLGWFAWMFVPVTYEAQGSVLLLPPGYELADGGNPFLELDNLGMPASLVAAYLNGDQARDQILRADPTADYTVSMDISVRGPIIDAVVSAQTPQATLDLLNVALDSIPTALSSLQVQQGVPAPAVITSTRLAADTKVTVVSKSTVRAVVAAVGLGLAATVAGVVLIDAGLRRRAERKSKRAMPTESLLVTQPAAPSVEGARSTAPVEAESSPHVGATQ